MHMADSGRRGRARGRLLQAAAFGLAVLACMAPAVQPAWAADKDAKKEKVRPPTKQTPVIRQAVFKKLEAVQKLFDAKDYAGALAGLEEIRAGYDKLSDYEKATLWGVYASIHYARDDTAAAIDAYLKALAIKDVPDGLRDNNLYALAQMYIVTEQYPKAIKVLDRYLARAAEPGPDAYALLAQAYFQSGQYAKAETPILKALKIGRDRGQAPREHWLSLLRAVYYELDQYAKSAKVLTLLIVYYPKEAYWLQLSGMYGLMENVVDQLAALRAAYEAGLLSRGADRMNLARLYLTQEAPFPAVAVLRDGLASGVIEEDEDSLQLYAQALSLAQEYEAQVVVLEKLAAKTGLARHYSYLGQAYLDLGEYAKASAAFRNAVEGRELSKPGDTWMLLGNALYNENRFREARSAFERASQFADTEKQASAWVGFLSAEIARQQEVGTLQ